MKKDNKVLLIVIMIFFIVFFCICVFVDVSNKNSESITMVFLSLVNVIVMGVLTYLLLETSQKSNETNELLAKHTMHTFYSEQIKKLTTDITLLRNYLHSSIQLNILFLQYLSYEEKYNIVESIVSSEIKNGKYLYINDIKNIINNLNKGILIDIDPYFEHSYEIKKSYTIKDIRISWSNLKNIEQENVIKLGSPFAIEMSNNITRIEENIKFIDEIDDNVNISTLFINEDKAKKIFSGILFIDFLIEEQIKNNDNEIQKCRKFLYFD